MRHRKYKVGMKGCTKFVDAFNTTEAQILAQAKAIQDGRSYLVI